jgi:hypothetical protein
MKSVLESVHCEGLSRHCVATKETIKKDLTKQQKCAIVLYIDSTETTSSRLCLKKNIH